MKKAIIAVTAIMFLIACGGSSTEQKPIEATYDSVGVDSSNILPPLTDSAKLDTVNGNTILKPVE